ncbi:hypothetical protein EVAR_29646_1 [Eumeta japonica]|uniref:Uncharacterized protein n=1 Tax=Eumeta variegata TaxID=151549 RepID=A0A4C1WA83_EUMVA|nr:hypothetical protein EVAR_29646_1 [Eumeta japonica]
MRASKSAQRVTLDPYASASESRCGDTDRRTAYGCAWSKTGRATLERLIHIVIPSAIFMLLYVPRTAQHRLAE